MASYRLTASPSGGQSEVLDTLHYQGAIRSGIPLYRIGPMVSNRWHGDENRQGSDSQWETDIKTVLGQLQGLGYVTGHDVNGSNVDLTGSPPGTTFVALTGAGRVAGRHPNPNPRTAPY